MIKSITGAKLLILATSTLLTLFPASESAAGSAEPPAEPASVPTHRDRLVALGGELKKLTETGGLKSLAVGVVREGEVVWADAWGWADEASDTEATIQTPYGVASLGKAMTATAAMTLVEEGRLDLDTSVDKILGSNAVKSDANDRAPTVRELLNMTSGIPHGAMTFRVGLPRPESELVSSRFFAAFPPGEVFHYSNFSIALVEAVIEEVTGDGFQDFMQTELFGPLSMRSSYVTSPASGQSPATKYFEDGSQVGSITPLPRSSRQISASLEDLLRFASFHLGSEVGDEDSILSESSLDSLHTEKSNAPGAHVALGWGHFDLGDGRSWVVSSGNDWGVQSHLSLLPDEGVGIVVLTNTSGYTADEIAVRIAETVSPGFMADAIGVMTAFQTRSAPFSATDDWLGTWQGKVDTVDAQLEISMTARADNSIDVRLADDAAQSLSDATFRDGVLTGHFTGMLPLIEQAESDHRIELTLHKDGDRIVGFATANFESKRGKFEIPTRVRMVHCSD